jgi:tetratricopeptide (TPR) repeat protein
MIWQHTFSRSRMAAIAALALMSPMALWSVETSPTVPTEEPLLTIPYPDLTSMRPATRHKIESVQKRLEEQLAAEDADVAGLVDSFGFLGQMMHAFEKLDAAEASYENARTLAPGDARWPYYLGLIRVARGDFGQAVEDFRAARSLDPDDQASALRLADVLLDLGRLDEAEIYYDRLQNDERMRAAALWGLGRIADFRGESAVAVDLFEQVLEMQPEADSVHYALGQAYRALGDRDRAQRHLDLGAEGKVGFPDPHVANLVAIATSSTLGVIADLAADEQEFSEENFLGFVFSQLGTNQAGVVQLENVLRQLVESGQSTPVQVARLEYAIGGLLVRQGRDAESEGRFRRAASGDPNLVDARVKLGNVLARLGRLPEALEAFEEALTLRPDDTTLLAKRATALANLDRLAEARADLDRIVTIDADNPDGWRLLSGVQERQGDLEGALASMQRSADVTERPLDKMERFTELGDLNLRWRRAEGAARAYLEALRIDQEFVPALSRLAALMGQLDTYDRSAEVYRKWIVVEPENPEPRVGEATALILDGQFEEARDRLEEGLALIPESLDLKDILARHLSACPDPSIRDGERALELARELFASAATSESMETLAMAHAQAGDFDQAISWQTRLLDSVSDEIPEREVVRWRANLELYESRLPCCAVADTR